MRGIFEAEREWERFQAIAVSWLGTPYRHLQAAKGRGADCTLFVGSCLVEAGYMTRLDYDYYPRDWHVHTGREFVLESAHKHFRENMAQGYAVERLDPQEEALQRGDMVAFKTPGSQVTNHAGLVWPDGTMINSMNSRGVCFLPLTDQWMRRATTIFRFTEGDAA